MKIKPLKIKTSSYKVENVITFQIGENKHETATTYDILLKNSDGLKYDFLLDRGKISINGSLPDTKFLSISDDYFSCLFPIHFLVKNEKFIVANFSEINDRIIRKDKELKSAFSGDGIDYISSEFLAKTNSEEKMQRFISGLNIVNALQFSLQKTQEITLANWNILLISNTLWEGYSTFDIENIFLEYDAAVQISTEFIEKLNHFALSQNCEINFTASDEFSSKLHHETKYLNQDLKFIIATNHIAIKHSSFEYNEAFTIKSKTAK